MTTDSRHAFAIAPNLLSRDFKITVPDTVWLTDISYIPTGEGWLYRAVVKGEPLKAPLVQAQWRTATMEIVGWSMSERLKSTLCEDALKMAIRNRRPRPGLIVHTDKGVQYACDSYRGLLNLHRITASPHHRLDGP